MKLLNYPGFPNSDFQSERCEAASKTKVEAISSHRNVLTDFVRHGGSLNAINLLRASKK